MKKVQGLDHPIKALLFSYLYIGSDLSDEYSGSNYTAKLKGALAKAKANAAQGIPEIIEIAQNRRIRSFKSRAERQSSERDNSA